MLRMPCMLCMLLLLLLLLLPLLVLLQLELLRSIFGRPLPLFLRFFLGRSASLGPFHLRSLLVIAESPLSLSLALARILLAILPPQPLHLS